MVTVLFPVVLKELGETLTDGAAAVHPAAHMPFASQVPPAGGLQLAPSVLSSQEVEIAASQARSKELSLAVQVPPGLLNFIEDPSAQIVDSFFPEHSIHFPWLASHFPLFTVALHTHAAYPPIITVHEVPSAAVIPEQLFSLQDMFPSEQSASKVIIGLHVAIFEPTEQDPPLDVEACGSVLKHLLAQVIPFPLLHEAWQN